MATKATAVVEITGRDKTAAGFKKAQNSLRRFAASAKRIVSSIVIGVGALGAAFAGISVKLFAIGSDALETASKFEATFGASTDSVTAFAEEFRKMAGITRAESQAILANTGAIAQGLGFTQEQSAALSAQVVKLGGDLASFNNVEGGTVSATEAVNAALVGQTERLRSMGIVLLATDIQERALINSSKSVASELTKQEKATAALQLITERAGQAIGDLSRTQDSAANVAKQIRAEFRQLAEDLSVSLIPVFVELLPIFSRLAELIQGILPQVTGFFLTLSDMVGLTSAAVRAEIEAVNRAGLTVEQINARLKRSQNEGITTALQLIAVEELLERIRTRQLSAAELAALQAERGANFIGELTQAQRDLTKELEENQQINVALLAVIDKRVAQEQALTLATEERADAQLKANRARLLGALQITPGVVPIGGAPGARGPGDVPAPIGLPQLPEGLNRASEALLMFQIGFVEATNVLFEFDTAARGIDEILGTLAGTTLVNFRDGFVEAFEAIGAGDKVFESLGKAIKRSLADAATAEAKIQIAQGVAKLAAGLFPPNPAAIASSIQHFAAAALFAAAAGSIGGTRTATPGGGGVGGRGPISDRSIQQVQGVGITLPATIIIQGSLLDTSDPRQADALAKALSDLSGRRVEVAGT